VRLRPEERQDFDALRELHRRAFAPSEFEADVVDALRAAHAHVPDLCLVATEDDDTIRGHVMLSHARIDTHPALRLPPAEATFAITTRYDAPAEAWMALALPAYEPHIRGGFAYAEAFGDAG
jgi:hypothetical protein